MLPFLSNDNCAATTSPSSELSSAPDAGVSGADPPDLSELEGETPPLWSSWSHSRWISAGMTARSMGASAPALRILSHGKRSASLATGRALTLGSSSARSEARALSETPCRASFLSRWSEAAVRMLHRWTRVDRMGAKVSTGQRGAGGACERAGV